MSHSKITTLLVALSATIMLGAATPVANVIKKAPTKAIPMKRASESATARPKAPSRQVVTCEYDGTYLTFGFVLPEGVCEATVTENFSGAFQTYTFDSTPLTADVYVGELYESTVTMTTASGNTYTGSLTADPE